MSESNLSCTNRRDAGQPCRTPGVQSEVAECSRMGGGGRREKTVQDLEDLRAFVVRVGGRPVEGGWDRLARYCGLEWSRGADETWAFRYYDCLPSPPDNSVEPIDVLACASMHPGLSKSDLTFFHAERNSIASWLDGLPVDLALDGADESVQRHLADLATWDAPVTLQLLTKVLHRKRPLLIPLVDRHILDWYRPITGERSTVKAWPGLVRSIREDLSLNAVPLHSMVTGIEDRTGERISPLRAVDIIVWMGGQG